MDTREERGQQSTLLEASLTPTNSASARQCLGCGRRRPARTGRHVTKTPSADMMTGFRFTNRKSADLFVMTVRRMPLAGNFALCKASGGECVQAACKAVK